MLTAAIAAVLEPDVIQRIIRMQMEIEFHEIELKRQRAEWAVVKTEAHDAFRHKWPCFLVCIRTRSLSDAARDLGHMEAHAARLTANIPDFDRQFDPKEYLNIVQKARAMYDERVMLEAK